MKIAVVHWLDAAMYDGSYSLANATELIGVNLVSTGALLRNDDTAVILAMDVDSSPPYTSYRHIKSIPRAYVTSIEILETLGEPTDGLVNTA